MMFEDGFFMHMPILLVLSTRTLTKGKAWHDMAGYGKQGRAGCIRRSKQQLAVHARERVPSLFMIDEVRTPEKVG